MISAEKMFVEAISRDAAIAKGIGLPTVDAIEFVTGEDFLGISKLYPMQSLVLKIYYRLWKKHPFTPEELELLEVLSGEWGITYDLSDAALGDIRRKDLLLAIGRRGFKTTVLAFVINYTVYRLLRLVNPQQRYGILQADPIYITVCAEKGDQAEKSFEVASNMAKGCKYFEEFIDREKDLETELRFFTPRDLLENKAIQTRNRTRPRGAVPEKLNKGSVVFWTTTTSAAGARGGAAIMIAFEEYAHFIRAKTDEATGEKVGGDASDYAMWRSLEPMTRTFGDDGIVVCISSPTDESGEFYDMCEAARGHDGYPPDRSKILFQLATWQSNPNITQESLGSEFERDPVGADQEWGAKFGKSAMSFLDSDKIKSMVIPDRKILLQGSVSDYYVVVLDASKSNNAYTCAWGHREVRGDTAFYCCDGLMAWFPKLERGDNNITIRTLIDPDEPLEFVYQLCNVALARRVLLIAYDQYDSSAAINTLKKLHLPAYETTFSNEYKEQIYKDFMDELHRGCIECYGVEASPQYSFVSQLQLEMKHIQKRTQGMRVFYGAPTRGPVRSDDFVTVVANLVSLLKRYVNPTTKFAKDVAKTHLGPLRLAQPVRPVRGGPIWNFGSSGIGFRPKESFPRGIRDR